MRLKCDTAAVANAFLVAWRDAPVLDERQGPEPGPDTLEALGSLFEEVYDPYALCHAIACIARLQADGADLEQVGFNIQRIDTEPERQTQ
jgi:hypothetical protein